MSNLLSDIADKETLADLAYQAGFVDKEIDNSEEAEDTEDTEEGEEGEEGEESVDSSDNKVMPNIFLNNENTKQLDSNLFEDALADKELS